MKLLLRTIALLLLSMASQAQPQYVFTRISNKEGLVSNYVYSILQDKRGFWWFGTANGLQRYDGRKIIMFKAGRDQQDYLPSQAVSQIIEDRSGKFWIRCGAEVGLFDPATFRYRRARVNTTGMVPPRSEYALWQSPQGEIMLIIRKQGFYTYDSADHSFKSSRNPFQLPAHWLPVQFASDATGNRFWIACDSGLVQYDPVTRSIFNRLNSNDTRSIFNQRNLNEHITSFFVDRLQRAWIVTWPSGESKQRSYCFDLKSNAFLTDTAGMSGPTKRYHELQQFFQQRNGTLWGFGRMLLLQYDPVQKRFYYLRNEHTDDYGIKYDDLLCMYEDREQNVWIGTDQGVYVFNPATQPFHSINLISKAEEESSDRTVTSFVETGDGELWAGTWGMGIIAFDKNLHLLGNRLTGAAAARDENFRRVWSLCQQRNGRIWAGCQSGRLIIHDPATKTSTYLVVPAVEEKTIRQVVEDRDGNVWIGTQYGHLVRWNPKAGFTQHAFSVIQNVGTIIYRILPDATGHLWVATHQKGLYKINAATGTIIQHFTTAGPTGGALFSDFTSDLAILNDSTLLAVTGALNIVNTRTGAVRQVSSMDGLPANNVNSVAVDNRGIIWLGMLGTLTRYNMEKNIFTSYSQKDGVLNSNFQSGATAHMSGGRLLFGTFRDFVAFKPEDMKSLRKPPDVSITDFKLFNTYLPPDSIIGLDKVRLKASENSITIEFAALSFLQKDKTLYYYRLAGIDNDWQRAENMLSANYKSLPAGSYTFEVYCSNSEGVASEHITRLPIYIEPPFWQTWWFIFLIAIAIAGLVYLAHRMRVNRLVAMERVRTRIARDLHDDMGSTLSTINILSEMAKMKVSVDNDKASEYIEKISDNSTRMMEAMDDIVWSINPMNDNMVKITARMREFATGVLEAKDISLQFHVDNAVLDIRLDMEQRRDFFLLFKEAVNNLAKYAQCRNAAIDISIHGNRLFMRIEDDGVGFDVNQADSGNGLTNMRKRAANIGGNLKIISSPGQGTTVRFNLALP